MDVIIHHKPNINDKFVSLFIYSIRTKKYPKWWTHYDCEYFPARDLFHKKKTTILNHIIERFYEFMHEVPNCEDCELVEQPINYHQAMMEDWD